MNLEQVVVDALVDLLEDARDNDNWLVSVLKDAEVDPSIVHKNEVRKLVSECANVLSEYV